MIDIALIWRNGDIDKGDFTNVLYMEQTVFFIYAGNYYIHEITAQANYTLRIDLTAFNGSNKFAVYKAFAVASESANYKLSIGGYYGTAGEYEAKAEQQ